MIWTVLGWVGLTAVAAGFLTLAWYALRALTIWFLTLGHPAPAERTQPGPGPHPVPGPADGPPKPQAAALAPGLYGRCLMVTWSFDSGITLVHDRYRAQWHVNLPPLDDDQIAALLDREAPDGV